MNRLRPIQASAATVRLELPPLVRLAVPVVVAELGWMAMSVVDTIMVGRLGAEAIGAVSLGTVLFYTIGVFGTGMLLGLDTLVPHSFGARNIAGCHRALVQALYGVAILAPALMLPLLALLPLLTSAGFDPEVTRLTIPYTRALVWSTLPLLGFMACRHYLQGMNIVRPIMFTLVSANLVNVAVNWTLIFGNLGFPALGVEGAGWASCLSRVYMFAALGGFLVYDAIRRGTGLFHSSARFDRAMFGKLASLGFTAGLQRAIEVGAFAAATSLIALIGALELASHQIALQVIATTFMVPLGISSAAAVRVGQALGAGKAMAASRSGWTALVLGAAFMGAASLGLLAVPKLILTVFTLDPDVIRIGVRLLYIAAVFQLFDGIQVIATGALRGAGDTRTPMLVNLAAHWGLGLPVGYWLCFRRGWGVEGIWIGLSLGLIAVGAVLLCVWPLRLRAWRRDFASLRSRVSQGSGQLREKTDPDPP